MLNWRNSIVFVGISILMVSCRPDFTDETQAVNSMVGVIDHVQNSSSEIDSRLVKQYIQDIKQKCAKIQNEMTDTLELEQAQMLVSFCALEGHLTSCIERKELVDVQVIETRNQLFNLQTDLMQQVADKDSANSFIESEFLYVESLSEGIQQITTELNGCFSTYSELKEEIDRLLIALPDSAADD